MENPFDDRKTVGRFLRRELFALCMTAAAMAVVLIVFLFWLFNVHIVITLLMILTGFVGLIPLGVYLYRYFSVWVEVRKKQDATFEVKVRGGNFTVINPPSVYFGISGSQSGQQILRMGIPAPVGLVLLSETLPQAVMYSGIEAFELPPGPGGPIEYNSVRPYPGDLTEIVSVLEFI